MSLSKQLYLGLASVLLLVFAATLWINVASTKDFISQQLTVHAQDAATSLGHTIQSDSEAANDPELYQAIAEVRINVIFDSGYYQYIRLTDQQSKLLYQLENPSTDESIPAWFTAMFPIQTPTGSTEFLINWQSPRTITLATHPGYAYQQLWTSAKAISMMVFGLFLLTGGLVFWLLNTITKPIHRAAKQADEICQGNFIQVTDIPKPRELSLFVNAMNRMSYILKNMFAELSQQSEKYRQFAFVDELTQLPNRRAFNNQLSALFTAQEASSEGHLLIIHLTGLSDVNKSLGYAAGDEYVKQAASIATKITDESQTLFRISGSDLAVIAKGTNQAEIQQLAEQLTEYFSQAPSRHNVSAFAHIGVSAINSNGSATDVLAAADSALKEAKTNANGWALAQDMVIPQENLDWQAYIQQLLAEETLDLVFQPICDNAKNTSQLEVFARLSDANREVSMAQLFLVAEKYQLTTELDKLIIEQGLKAAQQSDLTLALNISRASLRNDEFINWLLAKLTAHPQLCGALCFEISEQSLQANAPRIIELIKALKQLGCAITLEHFGATTQSFSFLMQIKPDNVKIDGSYTQQLALSNENQLFVQSLINIAHNLNIKVIAELIETQQQLDILQSLFCDYYQGYFVGKPEAK